MLYFRKPKFWIIVISIIIVMAVGIGLVTNSNDVNSNNRGIDNELNSKEDYNQDGQDVLTLIEAFGEQLKKVSLSAPKDVVSMSIEENYSDYVTSDLLQKWQDDPESAPGRMVSSPWPDCIDIIRMEMENNHQYTVYGNIVEVTGNGEIAAKRAVEMVVKKINNDWFISSMEIGEYVLYDGDAYESIELSEEEVVQLVESINPYELEPTMSPKERYDLRTEIYSKIPEDKIHNFSHAIESSALQLYGIVSDNRYIELVDKENERWDAYDKNSLFGVASVLAGIEGYIDYQPLLDDIQTVERLCNEGLEERNILKIIDANRILQDLSRHLLQVPYTGEGEETVDYGDIHDLYFKASKTLEGR